MREVCLDNRYYARAFGYILLAAVIGSVIFFPALWATPLIAIVVVLVPSLFVNACMWALTKVSDFIYENQNEHLKQLEQNSGDEDLKEQLNLFIDRRVACPEALLAGQKLDMSESTCAPQKTQGPLMQEKDVELTMTQRDSTMNRNPAFVEATHGLFMKQAAPMDVLSEVAAQDMADLVGLTRIIPKSTLAKNPDSMSNLTSNKGTIHSREAISKLIAADPRNLKNTAIKQDLVGKFLFNLRAASYKTQAKEGRLSKLLLIQSLIP